MIDIPITRPLLSIAMSAIAQAIADRLQAEIKALRTSAAPRRSSPVPCKLPGAQGARRASGARDSPAFSRRLHDSLRPGRRRNRTVARRSRELDQGLAAVERCLM